MVVWLAGWMVACPCEWVGWAQIVRWAWNTLVERVIGRLLFLRGRMPWGFEVNESTCSFCFSLLWNEWHEQTYSKSPIAALSSRIDCTPMTRQPLSIPNPRLPMTSSYPPLQIKVGATTNPRWLAPEVIRTKQLSKASDVYSFGCIMYEMLTWRMPYFDIAHSVQVRIQAIMNSTAGSNIGQTLGKFRAKLGATPVSYYLSQNLEKLRPNVKRPPGSSLQRMLSTTWSNVGQNELSLRLSPPLPLQIQVRAVGGQEDGIEISPLTPWLPEDSDLPGAPKGRCLKLYKKLMMVRGWS